MNREVGTGRRPKRRVLLGTIVVFAVLILVTAWIAPELRFSVDDYDWSVRLDFGLLEVAWQPSDPDAPAAAGLRLTEPTLRVDGNIERQLIGESLGSSVCGSEARPLWWIVFAIWITPVAIAAARRVPSALRETLEAQRDARRSRRPLPVRERLPRVCAGFLILMRWPTMALSALLLLAALVSTFYSSRLRLRLTEHAIFDIAFDRTVTGLVYVETSVALTAISTGDFATFVAGPTDWSRSWGPRFYLWPSASAARTPSFRSGGTLLLPLFWCYLPLGFISWWGFRLNARRPRAGQCRNCGYPLMDAGTCPECGRPRDASDAAAPDA